MPRDNLSMKNIKENVPLSDYTTFHVGGPARFFCIVNEVSELKEACYFAKDGKLPIFVLGGGSNVLIADEGFSGLVIKNEIKGIDWIDQNEAVEVVSGAGENWDDLVRQSVEKGLFGFENLSGIPGSVGGAPVQNIGAYGAELSETLNWVEVFDSVTEKIKKLSNQECQFAYRDSIFKKEKGRSLIITKVSCRLLKKAGLKTSYKDVGAYFSETKETLTLEGLRRAVLKIRAGKFPDLKIFGTAGSFFKNPIISREDFDKLTTLYPDLSGYRLASGEVKVFLAWIIENICKMKGYREGDAGVSEKQAIVLLNYGKAKSEDIKKLAKKIIDCVREKTNIEVEMEVGEI